jgi:hypothetical protein
MRTTQWPLDVETGVEAPAKNTGGFARGHLNGLTVDANGWANDGMYKTPPDAYALRPQADATLVRRGLL